MSGLKGLIQRCTGGILGGTSETPQFLILGLDKAGKTTLLYRLKLGQSSWPDDEIQRDMIDMRTPNADGECQDPGYHYEELSRPFSYGLWEVPGTDAMRHVWPTFYRSIKIHGIIFVVGVGSEETDERIDNARKQLHNLMNEDELRNACFCVIVNQQVGPDGKKIYDETEDELQYRFGLHDLHQSCNWRTRKFVIDVLHLKGESDPQWTKVMEFARSTLKDSRGFNLQL
eukprot:TRINITY_DN50199_c0_g1_i1.p1 TRINITY_DN50199_c0_g1~~TRINITY_DN50199_c0_g1_i1.p1  ORF type:complete len:229 (-),score=35.58 TRINITY_DN50199_c0_g1_i1:148-834(-)